MEERLRRSEVVFLSMNYLTREYKAVVMGNDAKVPPITTSIMMEPSEGVLGACTKDEPSTVND